MRILFGINGKARSGKDTLAKVFLEAGFTRVAFADALKEATAVITGEPVAFYHDDVHKELTIPHLGVTRRKALQGVGNTMRSVLGDQVWLLRALLPYDNHEMNLVVVTDVRYPNEAEAIRKRGGCVIRVLREGSGLTGEASAHVSEQTLDDSLIDIEVLNDGTIGELRHEGRKILEAQGNRRPGIALEHLGVDL